MLKSLEERIKEIKGEDGAPIICWGTGEKAKGSLPHLSRHGVAPVCFCDSDEGKWGKQFAFDGGIGEILSPQQCRQRYPNARYVICTEIGHYEQIIKQLEGWARYYHCNYPFKVDPTFLDIKSEQELGLLAEMSDALADDTSREIFQAAVNYKLNGDIVPLVARIDGNTLLDPLLWKRYQTDETYIDCGAYTGDTMIHFLEFCQGNYGNIRLYDGDHNNCAWMQKLVGLTRLSHVTVHEALLWHRKEELEFYTYDLNSDAYVYENADVSAWRKENICSRKKEKIQSVATFHTERRTAFPLDELVAPEEKIGLIKISVVGSDMNALKGCEGILRTKKPAIVVEWAGCKEPDVWEMIPFLMHCNPDYQLYLRQKRQWAGSKTILYAV